MSNIASSILTRLQDLVVHTDSTSSIMSSITARLPGSSAGGANATSVVGSLTHISAPASLTNAADRKVVEKCYRAMESVLRLCRQPTISLKKSPPCILDIVSVVWG